MNHIDTLLLFKVHPLFRFPWFFPNVIFFLFQDTPLHLDVMSPVMFLLSGTVSQTFLVFDDLDSFEESWSGIM